MTYLKTNSFKLTYLYSNNYNSNLENIYIVCTKSYIKTGFVDFKDFQARVTITSVELYLPYSMKSVLSSDTAPCTLQHFTYENF